MLDSGHCKAQSRSDVGQRNYIEQMMLASEKRAARVATLALRAPRLSCIHAAIAAPRGRISAWEQIFWGEGAVDNNMQTKATAGRRGKSQLRFFVALPVAGDARWWPVRTVL